jgi:hypothetical protein
MPIDSECKSCGKQLRVDDIHAGKKGRCPVCQSVYEIPVVSHGRDPIEPRTTSTSSGNPFEDRRPSHANESNDPFAETTYISAETSNAASLGLQQASVQSFVRTPDGSIYGPADPATLRDWIEQGRLDDTCFIRRSDQAEWQPLATWRRPGAGAPTTDPSPLAPSQPVTPMPKSSGYVFGAAPVPANQTLSLPNSGQAVASLVLGIAGWLVCITGLGGVVCAILAIVLGKMELTKIKKGQVNPKDRWMAMTGMWLGIAELVLAGIIAVCICIAMIMDQ